ncbi:transposase [Actinospica sp. MGRD01-02]|uniref:Transposase n=1 Tax=Actinospica acidithermotolerans TaxID=2828514 RepID=A0A941EB26_9ACTN|nr:transposase [Actinospica acidithermotolerans]MBR7828231.1 transposase [Actinospica acidithermotolerans]
MSNPYGNQYTAEFKRDPVALVNASPGRTANEIARELGVSPEGLRGWVKQARMDVDGGTPGSLDLGRARGAGGAAPPGAGAAPGD